MPDTPYTIIGPVRSRTARVLWTLEELGLAHEHLPSLPQAEDVRALNPSGKVPVLVADGVPITDSVAIMQFLADRHGGLTHPAGTIDRAHQDALTHLILDEMDALLWTAARHSFILPPEMRLPAIKQSLMWEYERNLGRIATRLGRGPWLMGDVFTIPDILLAHCVGWARAAKFPDPPEVIAEHHARATARPAWARAMRG